MPNGFKTVVWNNFGLYATPKFAEKYDKSHYRDDQNFHVVLEYPEDLAEHVCSGSLVIQLEVDTRKEEGWQEEVRYAEVPKYKLYMEKKSWVDAEAHCQDEGGHLASILTETEQDVVEVVAEGKSVWIGASDQDGVWKWSNGSPMNLTFWMDQKGIHGN